jgi:hypothetical protein
MNKLLLPEMVSTLESSQETTREIALDHACLVAEYMSYMAAAGYSTSPAVTKERSRGAWKFLTRFPEPRVWLKLPVDEQLRCTPQERNFVHYLFLRRLLPMPASWWLVLTSMTCGAVLWSEKRTSTTTRWLVVWATLSPA